MWRPDVPCPWRQTKRNENGEAGADIKKGTYVYQPLATIDVPQVTNLVKLLDGSCAVGLHVSRRSTSLTSLPCQRRERTRKCSGRSSRR